LDAKEYESLLSVADAAIQKERQNSFWYQAKAILLLKLNRRQEAAKAWRSGGACEFWNDYQTERLLRSERQLAVQTGAHQAWQYAYAYFSRSDVNGAFIEQAARSFLSKADGKSAAGLLTRYDCLSNGSLLRVWGRSIRISIHGANIVELAAYPAGLAGTVSPKKLWVGQTQFLTELGDAGMKDKMAEGREIFRNNDAWMALGNREDAEPFAKNLTIAALAAAEAPLGCLASAVVGALIWSFGHLLQRRFDSTSQLKPVALSIILIGLSLLVFFLSRYWIAALAVALSTGFLLVSTSQARKVKDPDFGPLFLLIMLALAFACIGTIVMFVVANSAPAITLAPAVSIPSAFFTRPALPALVIVLLSLTCIAAPLWGLFHRVGTPYVLGSALRSVGAIMAVSSLLFAVALGPTCVYADRLARDTLAQLVQNEPVYYLVQ
jgi:general stress protein CsbA